MAGERERMDSFSAVERRIDVTRRRLQDFPYEQATLTRLIGVGFMGLPSRSWPEPC